MGSFGRLLLRFLLVPLGIVIALCVAVVIVIVGQWQTFLHTLAANPDVQGAYVLALIFFGPIVALVMAGSTVLVLTPGLIGILIAEAFAIRSWIYHLLSGVVSAWVGWTVLDPPGTQDQLFPNPALVLLLGIGAGFAYWAVAGWNAGFYKPVFTPPPALPPPHAPPAPPAA